MTSLISYPCGPISGSVRVPGDKSISHRALILAALAVGMTRIRGLSTGDDVHRTARALAGLGVHVHEDGDGQYQVHGVGIGGLRSPGDILDLGNSGTAARLMLGVLATHPLTAVLSGDASLRSRPMDRVLAPLASMGARFSTAGGGRLPITISGTDDPIAIDYRLPVASAQVKSAILLAGLAAPGRTTVIEPTPTRDHTEILLDLFGAEIETVCEADGTRTIGLTGEPELRACDVNVPGDFSAAAFALVAAALAPGSQVTVDDVGLNPLRTGLIRTLHDMGADLDVSPNAPGAGETTGRITARHARLRGIEVPAERGPSMIDEFPVLAVAAACAEGTTVMRGLSELRVKESDRLDAIAQGLAACGVEVRQTDDGLIIHGCGGPVPGGAKVASRSDHRIAMAFAVLGMAAQAPIQVDDAAMIETSFPGFAALMNSLGARIEAVDTGGTNDGKAGPRA